MAGSLTCARDTQNPESVGRTGGSELRERVASGQQTWGAQREAGSHGAHDAAVTGSDRAVTRQHSGRSRGNSQLLQQSRVYWVGAQRAGRAEGRRAQAKGTARPDHPGGPPASQTTRICSSEPADAGRGWQGMATAHVTFLFSFSSSSASLCHTVFTSKSNGPLLDS